MLRKYLCQLSLLTLAVCLSGCGGEATVNSYSGPDIAMQEDLASRSPHGAVPTPPPPSDASQGQGPGQAGDRFDPIVEEGFLAVQDAPLSTFSIDVDTASYSKTRQYLMEYGTLPPPDAVRIEEMVNYFDYEYAPPDDSQPFAVDVETAGCPWRGEHRLVRIGIKGRQEEVDATPKNLVFLIDVSGSMSASNKLPLVKQGLQMLVNRLDGSDHIAIVVYASAAGMVLPPTPISERSTILNALNRLHAGGSTNGGEGIRLAYNAAKNNFVEGGVNRVVLCTDGDFNVGVTGTGELVDLAESNAAEGIYLSVLGFGIGNLNDVMLEQISNKANGNYAFIDTPSEARKVLVDQLSGTLVTIAKDVKIQVEFNPARVAAYRLIGYENRRLADRDFNDDTKDAGEIGAGHTVTALYEVTPSGLATEGATPQIDPLKYQADRNPAVADNGELLTVKLRYKLPDQSQSTRLAVPITDSDQPFERASGDYRFAAAVALFGMVLRNSPHRNDAGCEAVYGIANDARGADRHGYRAEFLEMVQRAATLGGEELAFAEQQEAVSPHLGYIPPQNLPPTPRAVRSMSDWRTGAAVVIGIVIGVCVSTLVVGTCLYLFLKTRRESRWEAGKPTIGPPDAVIPPVRPTAHQWPTGGAPAASGPKGL